MTQTTDNAIAENISEDIEEETPPMPRYYMTELLALLKEGVIILLIIMMVRWLVISPFRINGSSMEASYHDKEYILVDKLSYFDFRYIFYSVSGDNDPLQWLDSLFSATLKKIPLHFSSPDRGDVVVLTPHVDRSREYYIKRIIGMPGDTIRIEDGKVWIRPKGAPDFIQLRESYLSVMNQDQTFIPLSISENTFVVPEESYWVMGDNRTNSADSRQCFRTCSNPEDIAAHFVKRDDIIGKVFVSLGYFQILDTTNGWHLGEFSWIHPLRFFSTPRTADYPELFGK